MCTGAELAIIAAAASAAGTAVSTVGAIQQGKSAQNLANYNAQIAQNEAIAARQKAEFDAKAQERQARLFAGSQRASMASTGGELLDMGDVVDMSAEEAELENLAIRYGGDMGLPSRAATRAVSRF
jgi:predicted metalloprotease